MAQELKHDAEGPGLAPQMPLEPTTQVLIDAAVEGYILYHGTSSTAEDRILVEGLIPKGGKGCDAWTIKVGLDRVWFHPGFTWERPFVFLTEYPKKAMRYAQCAASVAGGDPGIIEVQIPDTHLAQLHTDYIHAWMFEGAIP